QEGGDQQLARLRVAADEGVVADRGDQDGADPQGAGLGRAVQALEELRKPDQAEGPQQHEEAARQQQQRQHDLIRVLQMQAHSTMSRRSTYLLSTTVLPKPSMAMINAA